jgi:hypothetical protein
MVLRSSSEGPCYLPENYNTHFNISSIYNYSSEEGPVVWSDIQCKPNYNPSFTPQSPPPCMGDQDGENTTRWSWIQEGTPQGYLCSSSYILEASHEDGDDDDDGYTRPGGTLEEVTLDAIGTSGGPCILPPYYTNTNFNIKTISDSDINRDGTVDWDKIKCKDNSIKQEKNSCILIEDDENEGTSQWSWFNTSSPNDILCSLNGGGSNPNNDEKGTCGDYYESSSCGKGFTGESSSKQCNGNPCTREECCIENQKCGEYFDSTPYFESSCGYFKVENDGQSECAGECTNDECCKFPWSWVAVGFGVCLIIGVIIALVSYKSSGRGQRLSDATSKSGNRGRGLSDKGLDDF